MWITAAAGRARAALLAKAAAHERAVLEDFGTQQGQQLKDTLRRLIALHTGR